MANPPSQPEWQPGQPPPWDQPQPPQGIPPQPAGWAPGAAPPGVPYTPMPQQPPAKRGFNFVPIIALIVVVGVIAGAYFLFRDQLSGDVGDLRVGDCFDEPANDTSISDVQHRPCNQAHDAEVFLLVTDPAANGASYPGADHFRQIARDQCLPASSTYIGVDVNSRTDLDVGYFYPTSSSWSNKDRGVTCYLYNIDSQKLTTSLKASGARPSSSP